MCICAERRRGLSYRSYLQRTQENGKAGGSKYVKGNETLREVRDVGGYMTVEVSAVLPIIFMILWLFLGYLFYFMNCGIAQGIMAEVVPKAADVKMRGADYKTGEVSYGAINRKLINSDLFSKNEEGDQKAEKEIRELLSRHLFLGKVVSVSVSSSTGKVKAEIKTKLMIPAADFLSIFGFRIFEYEGEYQTQGLSEIEKVRRWSVIERAVD